MKEEGERREKKWGGRGQGIGSLQSKEGKKEKKYIQSLNLRVFMKLRINSRKRKGRYHSEIEDGES